jgi:hypothetical protein
MQVTFPRLVTGQFVRETRLPDREIACDYHKRKHKRRADNASVGERKNVTTYLTAIFHSWPPIALKISGHCALFVAPPRSDRARKPKDKNYIRIQREAPGKGTQVSTGYTFTGVLRLSGARPDGAEPSVRLTAFVPALPAEAIGARASLRSPSRFALSPRQGGQRNPPAPQLRSRRASAAHRPTGPWRTGRESAG